MGDEAGPGALDCQRRAAEQAAREYGWGSVEYRVADHALLTAEREAAPQRADEYVVDVDLGTTWDANVTEPWLVQREGAAVLVVLPDGIRDKERRLVVMHWVGCKRCPVESER